MDAHDQLPRLEVFDPARAHVRSADDARHGLMDAWNRLRDLDPFEVSVNIEPDGSGELWVSGDVPTEVSNTLQANAQTFLASVKAAMDAAILAAAETVCTPLWPVDSALHSMPLCRTQEEFSSLIPEGHLLGLRPDQVRFLHELQPYQTGDDDRDFRGRNMTHLVESLAVLARGDQMLCPWATSNEPEFLLPDGVQVISCTVQPPGPVTPDKLLARFRVTPGEAAAETRVVPSVALDPVFNAPPWPAQIDDNLNARTSALLAIARRLIDILERSVSTPTFIQQFGRLDDLIPTGNASVWAPVQFEDAEQEAGVREGLEQSDLNLASYRGDGGAYMLLRLEEDTVVGREIPEASPPEPSVEHGIGVERASLAAAATLGLPDFVLRPKVVRKGSGQREIGDGTLVTTGRGIALQVKARNGATNNVERETSWLKKKAGEGLRQAHGTIRTTLNDPDLTLTNLRERTVRLPGDTIDWISVVILDHPDPPPDVLPDEESDKRGLVLLRRDWEFLWSQLRSVAAIVDYAHRVADDDRIPLGTEADRYFDLADRDARTEPEPAAEWMAELGGSRISGPRLPQEPTDSSDITGHEVFLQILEDIAATDFIGEEQTRIEVLARIDQVAVTHRAELGRTLLRRIDHCALTPADTFRAQHRVIIVDQGQLHLAFSIYSQLTGYHRQLYETWLLLRRQSFLQASGAEGPDFPWTVGVLLTPRPDSQRLWDTTVLATNGGPTYGPDEFARLADIFDQGNDLDPAIT